MRIAQVTDVPDGLSGGIERHVFNLVGAQKARGDTPTVVVPAPGGLTAACEESGIPVAVEENLTKRRPAPQGPPVDTRSTTDDLCTLFADMGAEIIHCHDPKATSAIAAGNRLGIPCVYTHHVNGAFRPVQNLDVTVITVCRSTFETIKNDGGFPEEKLYCVPNGTRAMPRVTSGEPRPSLISVGRLEHAKGHEIAILAMAELKRRHGPGCPPLNIYGAGSLEKYLKEMVSVLGLEDTVRLRGIRLGVLENCPATDILVISSIAETGPLVTLEAMSRGMPVVGTRVGEIAEMIPDQRYGYVVQARSIRALADGIESMLADLRAGRFDPELPIARHREFYTAEKMAEGVDAVYKCLVARDAPVG